MDYVVFLKNVCEENLFSTDSVDHPCLKSKLSFIREHFKVHCCVCFLKCVSASFASSRLVKTEHNIYFSYFQNFWIFNPNLLYFLMDGVASNTVPSAVGGAALNGAC